MRHLFRRELSSLLASMVVSYTIVLFLIVTASTFFLHIFDKPQTLSLRQFFSSAPFLLAFFIPALTMNTFARERRDGTLALLFSMPLSNFDIIFSKFMAIFCVYMLVLATTFAYPISLSTLGILDWGPVIAGYIGLLLLGSAYIAIGLLVSSWSQDPIIAILSGFTLCFALYFLDQFVPTAAGMELMLLHQLSANYHFLAIARGVLDMRDIAYYLGITFMALGIAGVRVQHLRK